MNNNFKNKICELLQEINIEITEEKIKKFYNYMNLLLEWNEKINLTAITEENDIILKHFVDSLTVYKYIGENKEVIDIGTGAGFPGIPLAILNNKNEFTLLDSLNKRINFLSDIKEKLSLENITNIHARAEEFGQNKKYREKFDIAVSRAVANLSTLAEYLLPMVKIGGKAICMKGSNIEDELKDAEFAIYEFGGKIILRDEFYLPKSDITRNILVIEKIKNTPLKYPRKAGTPAKEPLIQ